jgi:hypothetical protein
MARWALMAVIRVWLIVVVLGGAVIVAPSVAAEATPQATPEPAVRWASYDVALDVGDGAIDVTETQVVVFRGAFRTGFATIPLREGDRIDAVHVGVGIGAGGAPVAFRHVPADRYREAAGTYTLNERAGEVEIDYAFEPTGIANDADANTRVIVLEYTMRGAIREVEGSGERLQEIWWTAISTDVTSIAPVARASVSIALPEPVTVDDVAAEPSWDETDGQVFTWRSANLGPGDALEVRLRFPALSGSATPAARVDPARIPGLRASEMRY